MGYQITHIPLGKFAVHCFKKGSERMATSLTFVSKEIQKYVIFEGYNYDLNQIIVEIVLGKLDKLGQK